MATALIAGQAVLCAVIGWVTFGGADQARSTTRAAGPDFGPALVVPPAGVTPVLTSAPGRPHSQPAVAGSRASAVPPSPPAPDAAGGTVTPSRTSAPVRTSTSSAARPPAPVPTASPTDGNLVLTPSPSGSGVQTGVVIGEKCGPEKADGLTVLSVAVRCLPEQRGDLVWQVI